jgi:anaerobic selenocysteine-containing dehydrogenase
MNRYFGMQKRIEYPTIDGERVEMDEALDEIASILGKKSLLYRGSGNLGVMQSVTNLLMQRVGGYLTTGSLCDGAGQAGIESGRGVNRMLPLSQIAKADTVIVWGRNPTVTNSHIIPYLRGKRVAVIDPVRTPLAKKADLHIQIKPRSDFYLAIMLSRFLIMEDGQNDEWLEERGIDIEDFYDFTRTFRIRAILEYMGLSLDDMGDLLNMMKGERVVFLVGNGIQKYSIGHYTMWAIDSLAALLGLFGREGCGVSYLGQSRDGFDDPFAVDTPVVSVVDTPFEKFDTVIVQGANPAESMPDSSRVVESLGRVENLVYFGLYENETSRLARVVLPAKNFLEKRDVRLSYGHHIVTPMPLVVESSIGISEYDFCVEILKRLGLPPLQSEESYISIWLEKCTVEDGHYIHPSHSEIPYSEGFGPDGDDDFEFIDDFDDDFEDIKRFRKAGRKASPEEEGSYWLITPKSPHSLNTQFERGESVYLHPSLGFDDGERVVVLSEYGECELSVVNSEDVRSDSVVIRSGTIGVNALTPPIVSEEGEGACYQEVKVRISAKGEEGEDG